MVVVAVGVLLVLEAVEVIWELKVMWVFLVLRVSVVLLMEVEVVRLHLQQLRLRQDVDRLEIVEWRGSLVPCPGCLGCVQIAPGVLVLLVVPVLEMDLGPLMIVLVLCRWNCLLLLMECER